MTKRNLSLEEKEAARKLLQIWNAKRKKLGLTQARAATELDFASPSSVYQYLHGLIPMGTDAIIKFAGLLGVKPEEIRPDLADKFDVIRPLMARFEKMPIEFSSEDWEIMQILQRISQDKKPLAKQLLEVIAVN